jgi:hypothetical protein
MVDLIKLTNLLDEAKCYEVIRQLRWPDGVVCLHCRGTGVVRNESIKIRGVTWPVLRKAGRLELVSH